MPLSLNQRKSLRDYDQNLKDALESIKNTTGQEYQVEIDFEGIIAKTAESKYVSEDPGNFFYKQCLANFAYCLEQQLAKEEVTKEAFVEATTARKIIFRINEDKKNTDYWKVAFEADSVILLFRIQPSNVGDISYLPLAKSIPVPGTYSLVSRLSLKEHKEKFDEALETLKSATGETWTYDEASLESVYKLVDENSKTNYGRVFSTVLENVAYNVKEKCKDDMIKEAFVEATPNHTIVFVQNAKQYDYWEFKFENGNLLVSFKNSITNLSDISYWDFTKLL
ncbi:hypothetical protein DLAC_00575 [Tieghemostelium lacteum]|uniref:Uncharacterized protein n=1 Tax=Tieghemostelium lacteum TaxID=361077 RepID=A0A152AA33_TIELA|nr:hypothetical protein DLAC_00575 [Tieghemostelium lacteum]|eukprot:KYR03083.1 hypothetical protein DLAC_00575 [Tieghemostelium lacteum]